ncbi:MAG TPA: hypothetical protein PK079_25570 [Leptospiraceae bacterium]|nr:hypothetical protein [Leptospiraceae bacterium]
MPIRLIEFNDAPLVHGFKIEIIDKQLLAKYVAILLLGYQDHIETIISSQDINNPTIPDKSINNIIQKISNGIETIKRDGWFFQMISWIAVQIAYKDKKIYSQIPHDAPAQHGIDGILVIMNEQGKLEKIIITEDKATENPRNKIQQDIFPEFKKFETGQYDHKLVNRITGFLKYISPTDLLREIQNDIYRLDLRKYRIGITHDDSYNTLDGYTRLFKDYDYTVSDADNTRRSAATFFDSNLRNWMEDFSKLIIKELENLKNV